MKRLLVIALALLLLTGCSGKKSQQTSQTTTTDPSSQDSQGWYIPDSPVEQQTGGAVRMYQLPSDDVLWLSAIGDKLLLATHGKNIGLTVLTGAECVPTATMTAGMDIGPDAGAYQAIYNGFVYYLRESNEAVYLDQQLQQLSRIKLPETPDGMPAFAPDGGQIFYCLGQEIRALDTSLNITRPIKSHTCKTQSLTGVYFDGKVLSCLVEYEDGTQSTIYLSSETGQTLSTDQALYQLSTYEDKYLALRKDGTVQQRIYGALGSVPANMNIPQDSSVASALELGGIVACSVDAEQILHLTFFDTATGKKTAALDLRGVGMPTAFQADRWSRCLWFLTEDPATGTQALYRWEISKTPVQEETVYALPVYTQAAPDTAGLTLSQKRADDLSDAHGIDIRIWNDGVKNPGDYTLEAEYQTLAIDACLNDLESVLGLFPEKFLYKSVNRKIRVCIVRSISQEITGVQYWCDRDAYIVLAVGCDVREEFTKAMGYVVNSHVLGNSPILDDWSALNPEGFVYGETTDTKYLEGESRAFVDSQSMTSVTEDRSRLFWQAMKEDNAAVFQSPAMQSKLRQLCLGIRDAWRLEKKTETFPWEQYLTESIAY